MNPFDKLRGLAPVKTPRPSTNLRDAAPPAATIGPSSNALSSMHASEHFGYLSERPGFARTLWAAHPNRTTRKIRQLLVAWEDLGYFLSFSGAPLELSRASENSFLKVKVNVARSISFLRSIHGVGDIGREANAKEREFIEILELYPSLYDASSASDENKRELFQAWHALYLFLHKLLGAEPYEVTGEAALVTTGLRRGIQGQRQNVRPFREGKMA